MAHSFHPRVSLANHREYYNFVIHKEPNPVDIHVHLEYLDDNKYFSMEHEHGAIWVEIDWMVFDWFKNYSRRMGINQVPEEEMVKALTLSLIDEI